LTLTLQIAERRQTKPFLCYVVAHSQVIDLGGIHVLLGRVGGRSGNTLLVVLITPEP